MDIYYTRGEMHINVPVFLETHNIKKFKKLLRVIENSREPELKDTLEENIADCLDETKEMIRQYDRIYTAYRDKLSFAAKEYNQWVKYRDQFKRGSKNYKTMTPYVKNARKQMHDMRNAMTGVERDMKRQQGQKAYYEKCLKVIRG